MLCRKVSPTKVYASHPCDFAVLSLHSDVRCKLSFHFSDLLRLSFELNCRKAVSKGFDRTLHQQINFKPVEMRWGTGHLAQNNHETDLWGHMG